METAARKLFQVVKDHNNQMMLEMVLASNNFCIASCRTTSDGLTLEIDSWVTAQSDSPCLSSNNNSELVETVKIVKRLEHR